MSLPPSRSAGLKTPRLPGSQHGCNRRLVKVAAEGAGGRAPDLRGPESFGDEVDDALLRLEGSGDAEERGRVVGPTFAVSGSLGASA